MSSMARGRGIRSQYVTSDLDASRVILLPFKNRHRFILTAHPGNTAGQGIWVHLIKGPEAPQGGGKLVSGANVLLANNDASADPGAGGIDATPANSGIFIPAGGNFSEDGSMQFIFDGGITAIATAAGQKLIVLEY